MPCFSWPFHHSYLIELHHIAHWYGIRPLYCPFKKWKKNSGNVILNDINLSIKRDRIITISGPSGCGKTTLLRIIAGLQRAKQGTVYLGKWRQQYLPDLLLSFFRSRYIGFVFQDYRLLANYSVRENILFALYFSRKNNRIYQNWFQELCHRLGIESLMHKKPGTLSGGEKQRVAIARALVTQPLLMVADEPTGNLDEENSCKVKDILLDLQKELGHTLLMVTHDPNMAQLGQEQYSLNQGVLTCVSK